MKPDSFPEEISSNPIFSSIVCDFCSLLIHLNHLLLFYFDSHLFVWLSSLFLYSTQDISHPSLLLGSNENYLRSISYPAAVKKTVGVSLGKAKWSPEAWKAKTALQQPDYPDQLELESVLKTIEAFPPIVFAGEARLLEERLGQAAKGEAFLLQGGDCAESFKEFNANNIRDTFRIILQMGAVLMFGGQVPIIKPLDALVRLQWVFNCCAALGSLAFIFML